MKMGKKNVLKLLCYFGVFAFGLAVLTLKTEAADYTAYQNKNVYEKATVQYSGLTVKERINQEEVSVEKELKFELYNSTKQETQEIITSEDGELPTLNLVKNHNYILFLMDDEYEMPNAYIWASDKLYDIKRKSGYPAFTGVTLTKRAEGSVSGRRVANELYVQTGSNIMPGGDGGVANIKVDFISDVETKSYTSDSNGKITAELLEDVCYMVHVEDSDGQYYMKPFPIAVKDKRETGVEYENGKYVYDYRSCDRVWYFPLKRAGSSELQSRALTSKSGKTSITGMDFKKLWLLDENLDNGLVSGLEGKDYEVIGLKTVNSYRSEVVKLVSGTYDVTRKVGKIVENVYYLDENGLEKLEFSQNGETLRFTMNTMSLDPVVIQYTGVPLTVFVSDIKITGASNAIAAGKGIQLNAAVYPENATNRSVTWTVSNSKYAKVTQSGKVTVLPKSGGKSFKVYATANDGSGTSAAFTISSKKGVVKSIKISGKKTVKAGKSLKLKAKVNATKGANKKVKWTSSNTRYAKVSSSGQVKTYPAGRGKKVKITVRSTDGSNKSKSVTIKIKK